MQTEAEKLKKWMVTQFRDGTSVSEDEAVSDMEVIWASFATAAGVSLLQVPENELARLRILFNEEWAKVVAEKHQDHAPFVKSLATKVAARAKLR
jgi:hypothetical protein